MTAATSFSELLADYLFSMAQLSWDLDGGRALARFHLGKITIEVTFDPQGPSDWISRS
jgi:hypothetical protein